MNKKLTDSKRTAPHKAAFFDHFLKLNSLNDNNEIYRLGTLFLFSFKCV